MVWSYKFGLLSPGSKMLETDGSSVGEVDGEGSMQNDVVLVIMMAGEAKCIVLV